MITTKGTKRFLSKLSALEMIPYVYDDDNNLVLGPDTYDLFAIVGDTIEVSQDDGEVDVKKNEFVNTPVMENVTSGEWHFKATCLDMQDSVLKLLFGVSPVYDSSDNVVKDISVFPDDFKEIYCLVKIRFADDSPDIILPKVLLNSKLMVKQMKTNFATGEIQGTAFLTYICVFEYMDVQCCRFDDGNYVKYTPLLFIPPNNYDLGVFHHYDDIDKLYVMTLCYGDNTKNYIIQKDGSTIAAY